MTDAPPTVPRHASTVVLARPTATGGGVELFMVRRSAKSPFMPDALVFPGGRLDPQDGPSDDDDSWVRAARRETAEETGLELGTALLWFDTWLTPSAENRRRYLTRFYWASVEREAGDKARADGHETLAGRWATAQGHLERWRAGDVDLPPPTISTLLRIADGAPAPREALARLDPAGVILPKVSAASGTVQIVMPHDPGYAQLDGESAPAPARAHVLPRRFERRERTWAALLDER